MLFAENILYNVSATYIQPSNSSLGGTHFSPVHNSLLSSTAQLIDILYSLAGADRAFCFFLFSFLFDLNKIEVGDLNPISCL